MISLQSAEDSTMKPTLSVSSDQSSGFQCKNKRKKEADLPRRASKRLAGIKVDQFPELQTRSRARRDATKQSGEEETIINAEKQFHAPDGSETVSKSDASIAKNTVEERVHENEDKVDVKRDYKLNFPLKELLSDPCLAFAIQTLTGVTFEIAKNPQISSEFKSSQHCETSASAEDRGKKINLPGDDAANENAGSSSEKNTLDTSWMDPCIEFAIKTLTGPTIPLDSDQNPKTCIQQQLSSSNNQHSEMANFGTQKPMLNQSFVDPTQQHARNIGIGISTGARLPHSGENRRNVCQK